MVDAVVQRFSRRVQNCLPVDTVLALDALVDATIDVIRRHHLSVQSRETDAAALQSIKRIRTALDLAGKAGLGSSAARQRDRLKPSAAARGGFGTRAQRRVDRCRQPRAIPYGVGRSAAGAA